ncbi:hypothetical protein QHF85_46445, partial [Polyangium sp. 6x1]
MSNVTIPAFNNLPDFQREDVASLVLVSIAMEEMGLSHILNAEGEKIQWILVSRVRNTFTSSRYPFEDLIRRLGPHEGLAGGVVGLDVGDDG